MIEHNGTIPSVDAADPKERELAIAYQKLKNEKIRQMMGLDYKA
jgi:hypothetical protein